MIRITIELWPYGSQERSRLLGTMDIINDGTGTKERGNYTIRFRDKAGRVFKNSKVKNWPRISKSIWKLIQRVFQDYDTRFS